MLIIRHILIAILLLDCFVILGQNENDEVFESERRNNSKVELGLKYGANVTSLNFNPKPYNTDMGYDLGQSIVSSFCLGWFDRSWSIQLDLGYLNNRSPFSMPTDTSVQTLTLDLEYFKFPLFYKRAFSWGHYYSKNPPEIYYMIGAELSYLMRGRLHLNRLHLKETGYVVSVTEDITKYMQKVTFSWPLALGLNLPISYDLIFSLEGAAGVGLTKVDINLFPGFSLNQIYYQINAGFYYLFPKKGSN